MNSRVGISPFYLPTRSTQCPLDLYWHHSPVTIFDYILPIMACHSLFFAFLALILVHSATGFTGSEYYLDAEYSGHNFFDGWDFFAVSEARANIQFCLRSRAMIQHMALSRNPHWLPNHMSTLSDHLQISWPRIGAIEQPRPCS